MIELLILYVIQKRDFTMYAIQKRIEDLFAPYTKPSFGALKPALTRLEEKEFLTNSRSMLQGKLKESLNANKELTAKLEESNKSIEIGNAQRLEENAKHKEMMLRNRQVANLKTENETRKLQEEITKLTESNNAKDTQISKLKALNEKSEQRVNEYSKILVENKKLLDRGYLTQEELATRMGKTQGAISNKLRLLNLSNEVQEALLNNEISERHARSLLKVEDEDEQVELLRTIIRERLNVRDTDKLIESLKETEELAPIRSYGKTLGGSSKNNTIDFDNLFGDMPQIEDKTYPEIEDKVYPAIETEETLLLDDEQDEDKKQKLQEKIKNFIEELKAEGFNSTYDSYEFDKLYEFIIKIDK